ncbi:MAG TPA: F0F1 ATP synthase subunit epsilon [Smithella sp.]|jgi:F-type H+-transporting ATPase subunit epsilon|nr:F0F1 ATP synthase subunit epsilon [Smithella sp.]OQC54761.1 MAG: ATP synthase epsilon chain [Deltaproteobacteria bacterium ADurb.Bin022]HNQ65725.1 F0F1 ATP synthase subunit epsilon [Smithella sp.]HOE33723.1 F0F1 ATP synthase subunit epsilon [Smithella sp.]HOG10399.1 F0F1 ATP synthase subunit epsilon [Smithella sp.]
MADELLMEIVTPEKMIFSGNIEEVTLPGTEGEFGVLRGHEAFLTSVEIGEMNYVKDGKKSYYAVNTGYVEVTGDKVTVLIETAEKSDQIDKERALKAKDNAESRLSQMNKDDVEFEIMRAALARAIARINVAEKQ